MIPTSMNRRTRSTSVSEGWELNDSSITESVLDTNEQTDPDSEYDSDETFENEYNYLRRQVNDMYDEHISLYNNEEEVIYKYEGLSILKTDIDEHLSNIDTKDGNVTVHICGYHINKNHKYPFLEYLLFKNNKEKGDNLHFPKYEFTNHMDVITMSLTVIDMMGLTYSKCSEFNFKGYLNDKNNVYLFFDCSGFKMDGCKMSRMNDLWMVTVDEIINQKKVCQFPIDTSVTEFFKMNEELMFITNINSGEIFETPSVVYSGVARNKLDLFTSFGIPRGGTNAILGNYYYFTDYQNAIKMTGKFNGENHNSGLIRFAVFLGKTKVLLNSPDDVADESKITENMLFTSQGDDGSEYKNIRMQLRISDRDGLWTNQYDSVYIGRLEMDDGSVFTNYPMWVVKEYEQQVVLSNHIIDKKTLGEKWSRDETYYTI